jgi:hypothetical protein
VVVIVVVCAVAAGLWFTRSGEPEDTPAPVQPPKAVEPVKAETPPPPEEPEESEVKTADAEPETPPEAVQKAMAEAAEQATANRERQPFEGVPITTESLTGCITKLGDTGKDIEFAVDHVWKVAGKDTAMWEIVGNQVKIYDEKGEEHYLDIEGDKLMFNGERVELWK